jgi:penicillin V acylase-like amidase (Ntn superfamily)
VSKAGEGIEKEYGPPAQWTSKYGSLTFNQYGRELPMGGINETGLVVESMYLMNCTYPPKDGRPVISGLQWIQYQLDNSSKVEDVIASDSQIRLYAHPGELRGHFLVADKEGNCATIEFINGKLVYHTRETLPVKVLANDIYIDNLENLKIFKEFGGNISISQSSGSLDRFARAANMLKNYAPDIQVTPVDYAFNILDNIAQPPGPWETKWSIVYDIQKLRIYFRTISHKKVRYVDLPSFDFSCQSPVKVMDINLAGSGDMTGNFSNYTQQANLDLIRRSFKESILLKDPPDNILEQISKYPERTSCDQQK